MAGFLLLIGAGLFVWGLFWLSDLHDRASKYDRLKPRLDSLDELGRSLDGRSAELTATSAELDRKEKAVIVLSQQKAVGFPWLATAYADFFHLEEMTRAALLERKKHPARKAADEVREAASLRRIAEKESRILRYQLAYYETLFPWLAELRSADIDEELIRIRAAGDAGEEAPDDAARKWLTPEEFAQLPSAQKYQLALDRYWGKKKTNWEIGRDYERYIGYLFEAKGFAVSYHGIVEGFDDLGRDLICEKDDKTIVVQCKYWSRNKTIHEKHLFQLYGTVIAYKVDHPKSTVLAAFITSTTLSERARMFAKVLGVEVTEGKALARYPSIKCNVARRGKEKIYHLPFDQQYDRTVIETERGEKYVASVAEAEQLGFRRAFRYRGPSQA